MPINIIDALESDKQVDCFIVRREEKLTGRNHRDDIENEIMSLPTTNQDEILKKVRIRELKKLGRFTELYKIKKRQWEECTFGLKRRKKEKESKQDQVDKQNYGSSKSEFVINTQPKNSYFGDPLGFMSNYTDD